MGGHGGLNILPQKRWNVYNFENREKVERDVRKAEEKKREQDEKQQQAQTEYRRNILRLRGNKNSKNITQNSTEQEKSQLNEELGQVIRKNHHINLFEDEQKEFEKKQNIEAKQQIDRAKLDKKDGFDNQTSNYLGNILGKDRVPWYLQSNGSNISKKQTYRQRQRNQVQNDYINVSIPNNNYYQVLDLEKNKKQKENDISQDIKEENVNYVEKLERDLELKEDELIKLKKLLKKEEKNKKKQEKKLKKEKKEKKKNKINKKNSKRNKSVSSSSSRSRSRSRSASKKQKSSQINEKKKSNNNNNNDDDEIVKKLREERQKRETKEREKALKLLREKYPFDKIEIDQ